MSKKEQRSILQDQAATLRVMKETTAQFEAIERALIADVEMLEIELMTTQTNLADTRALLKVQRDKLLREANNMHSLIEKAIQRERTFQLGEPV